MKTLKSLCGTKEWAAKTINCIRGCQRSRQDCFPVHNRVSKQSRVESAGAQRPIFRGASGVFGNGAHYGLRTSVSCEPMVEGQYQEDAGAESTNQAGIGSGGMKQHGYI